MQDRHQGNHPYPCFRISYAHGAVTSYPYQGLPLIFVYSIDAQGFKRFLRVTWEPFEAHFQTIEARFMHHTTVVVRLAGAEHQNYFYQKETQDKQRQEGE